MIKLEERFNKYYESLLVEDIAAVRKQYPNISDADFNKLIRLDPTFNPEADSVGTYGKWILNLFNKGKLDNIGHVTDLLKRFEDNKKQLQNKDINSFKTLDDVDNYLNDNNNYNDLSHRQEVRGNQKASRDADVSKDLILQGDKYDLYSPSSYANSCKLGKGTRWCTATTESDYYYIDYTSNDELYILVNKSNPKDKYQFHFATGSCMDKGDDPCNALSLLHDDMKILEYFERERPDIFTEDKVYIIKNLPKELQSLQYPTGVLLTADTTSSYFKDTFGSLNDCVKYIMPLFNGNWNQTFNAYNNTIKIDNMSYFIPDWDLGSSLSDYFEINRLNIIDGVTKLNSEVIDNYCCSITSIDFGNTLEVIEQGALYDNIDIKNWILPESLKEIGEEAINVDNSYTITIPNSVSSIGEDAFVGLDDHYHNNPITIYTDNKYVIDYLSKDIENNCCEIKPYKESPYIQMKEVNKE